MDRFNLQINLTSSVWTNRSLSIQRQQMENIWDLLKENTSSTVYVEALRDRGSNVISQCLVGSDGKGPQSLELILQTRPKRC